MPIPPHIADLRKFVGTRLLVIPSVAVVVHDARGRLLLVRDAESGAWSLPAGALELGEDPASAARRELAEETGIRALRLQLVAGLGGEEYRHTYPNGDRVEYQIFLYRAKYDGGNLGTGQDPEIVDLRFFEEADAPPLALPYPEHLIWMAEPDGP